MLQMLITAIRQKYRFESSKGALTLEDLFDLPLLPKPGNPICLDNVAKTINKLLKETESESFVVTETSTDRTLHNKLEIVKHIIGIRLTEQEAAAKAAETKAKKQQLLALIEQKQTEHLAGLDIEKLKEMLAAL